MTNFTASRSVPAPAYGGGYDVVPPYDDGYGNGHDAGSTIAINGDDYGQSAPVQPGAEPLYVPRSAYAPLLFIGPVALCGASWAANGVPFITDLGFLFLTIACLWCLGSELVRFPQRFGIGALIVYGGTLVWWCHDYFANWFGGNTRPGTSFPPVVIAEAAFITSLFVFVMTIGLQIRIGKPVEKLILAVPEASSSGFFFALIVVMFLIGVSPYFLFVNEPFYTAVYKDMFAMRSGEGAAWTVGRTGFLNFSWGAYIAHILQIGWLGAILAAYYAVMITRNPMAKTIAWGVWLFWFMLAVGSGTRGNVIYLAMPVIALMFIKSEARAAGQLRRVNLRGYALMAVVLLGLLAIVQYQGTFRDTRTYKRDVSQIDLLKNQGNHMFSEALLAYSLVPEVVPHARDTFPGAGVVRPIPDLLVRFGTGWIPRTIWRDKPAFDDFGAAYNKMISGGTGLKGHGATICLSIAGGSYVTYGIPGVIEMALLFGWLCGLVERAFLRANLRPVATLFLLGLMTYFFRCYRDLTPHDLYPLLIGMAAMCGIVLLARQVFPQVGPSPDPYGN